MQAQAQGRHHVLGARRPAARWIRRTRRAARSGWSRTSPSSSAPRRSCSACSPSSRRSINNVVVGIAFLRDRKTRALQPALRGDVRLRRRARPTGISTRAAATSPMRSSTGGRRYIESSTLGATPRARAVAAAQGRLRLLVPASPAARSSRATSAKGYVWLFEDITETQARRTSESQRMRCASRSLILDNATVGIAFVRNRVIQRCNRFSRGDGGRRRPASSIGQPLAVLFASEQDWEEAARAAPTAHRARRARTTSECTLQARRRHRRSSAARAAARIDAGERRAGMDLELRGRDRRSARPTRAAARSPSRS